MNYMLTIVRGELHGAYVGKTMIGTSWANRSAVLVLLRALDNAGFFVIHPTELRAIQT